MQEVERLFGKYKSDDVKTVVAKLLTRFCSYSFPYEELNEASDVDDDKFVDANSINEGSLTDESASSSEGSIESNRKRDDSDEDDSSKDTAGVKLHDAQPFPLEHMLGDPQQQANNNLNLESENSLREIAKDIFFTEKQIERRSDQISNFFALKRNQNVADAFVDLKKYLKLDGDFSYIEIMQVSYSKASIAVPFF